MRGILLDENGELMVQNGSVQIGDNSLQCVQHLILAWTGEYKNAPLLGGNVKNTINGVPDPFWVGDVKKQAKLALVNIDSIVFNENGIEINVK